MKKNILKLGLVPLMALSLCACGGEKEAVVKTQETFSYSHGVETSHSIFNYDEKERIIHYEATTLTDSTSYDVVWETSGNLAKGVCSTGEIQEYEYDRSGNVLNLRQYNKDGSLTHTIAYTYVDGTLKEHTATGTDADGSDFIYTAKYNENEDLIYGRRETNLKKQSEFEYNYEYNENGDILSTTCYDLLTQATTVTKYQYNENGHLEKIYYSNGNSADVTCDENGNIIEQRSYYQSGDLYSKILYTYYE